MAISKTYAAFSVLHVILLALGANVCGLYGTDLYNAGKDKDSKWIFAVVVGGLSVVTCILYLIQFIFQLCPLVNAIWDFILFVLWIAVFGLFGQMYIPKDAGDGSGIIGRMRNAVWVDLANALGWLIVALAMTGYWFKTRGKKTRFTGRAYA